MISQLSSCSNKKTNIEPNEQSILPQDKHIISVFQTEGWGNTEKAVALINEYANKINLKVKIKRTVIKTDADVKKYKFIGSPTIRINGLDLDPKARDTKGFGFTWRLMNWTQGASATEKMLNNAFIEAGWI